MKFSLALFAIGAVLVCQAYGANMMNSAVRQGAKILNQSKTGDMIRECSCPEQRECVAEMKKQVIGCFDECYPLATTGKIHIKSPETLKTCFQNKNSIANSMLDCMQDSLNSCVDSKDGKQIAYTDINVLLDKSEAALKKKANIIQKTVGKSNDNLIDVAFDIGHCMKTCFQKQNAGGYCFDKKSCQPLIDSKDASKGLNKCLKAVQWKKQASDVCECTVKAGVSEMEQYCGLLNSMNSNPSQN
uniref:DB domain-containing protein n=1 Tax=Panagrellus redivivus TaxID=6233 RepID=A0A7E4VJG1_PANRE